MSKKDRRNMNQSVDYERIKSLLIDKYLNLWRASFKFISSEDEEGNPQLGYQETKFLIDNLWEKGTVAVHKNRVLNKLILTPYAPMTYTLYGFPASVNLVNLWNAPVGLIPNKTLPVDDEKGAVLIWANHAHKPMAEVVDWYCSRIAECYCIENNILMLSKVSYLIGLADDKMKTKAQDIVDRILRGELVLFAEGFSPEDLQVAQTQINPALLQQIVMYRRDLEAELKVLMGLQANTINKNEQVDFHEASQNDEEVEVSQNTFLDILQESLDRIKKYFDIDILLDLNYEVEETPDDSKDGSGRRKEEEDGEDYEANED